MSVGGSVRKMKRRASHKHIHVQHSSLIKLAIAEILNSTGTHATVERLTNDCNDGNNGALHRVHAKLV